MGALPTLPTTGVCDYWMPAFAGMTALVYGCFVPSGIVVSRKIASSRCAP
jgi:hypothetical protein